MKFSIVAVLSAVVSTVYAQAAVSNAGVAINLPAYGVEIVTAGQPYTIKWTVVTDPPINIKSIALSSGASSASQVLIPNILASPIPANPPQYVWNVPATIPTNPAYKLAFTGYNGVITYSNYFTIIGAPADTSNTSLPTPTPDASLGAPATSGYAITPSGSASASKESNSASTLKTGAVCIAGVTGAVALLL